MQSRPPLLWSVLWAALSFSAVLAQTGLTNRTIDDEEGDSATGVKPVYSPSSGWKQGNPCNCNLNVEDAFKTTWHDATQEPGDTSPRTITMNFTGTAVYVYNTLADARVVLGRDTMTTTDISLTFDIDGAYADNFFQANVRGILYKAQVFSKEGLSDGPHTLKISVVPPSNPQSWSVVLFDYVAYVASGSDTALPPSAPPPSTPSTPKPPTTTLTSSNTTSTTTQTSDSSSPPLSGPTSTSNQTSTDTDQTPTTPSSTALSTSSSSTDPALQPSASPSSAAASTSSASLQASSIAAIAGGASGGTVVLVLAGYALFRFVRWRRGRTLRFIDHGSLEQYRVPTQPPDDLAAPSNPPQFPRPSDSDRTMHEVTPFPPSVQRSRHSSKRVSGAHSRRAPSLQATQSEPSAYSTSESSTSTQALLDTHRRTRSRVPSVPSPREANSAEEVRLRAQVAALEQEMTRMAVLEREMERVRELVEDPPEYELPETRTEEGHAI